MWIHKFESIHLVSLFVTDAIHLVCGSNSVGQTFCVQSVGCWLWTLLSYRRKRCVTWVSEKPATLINDNWGSRFLWNDQTTRPHIP